MARESAGSVTSSLFPYWLKEYQDVITEKIRAQYGNGRSELEASALEAISGGKQLRAVLTLLWCEAVCGEYSKAVSLAVAYELAHGAALVEDDVIDGSYYRRGEKSIVGKYGVSGAILTSNALLFSVPEMITDYARTHQADGPTICSLLDLFGQCFKSSTMGEFLDLKMASQKIVTEAEYTEMVRLKTGALIGASSASGAIIGGGSELLARTAYTFGEAVGVAYQVQDDLLDLLGDEKTMGKPIFTDLRGGKKSLALIHFLLHCSFEEAEFINTLLERKGQIEEAEIQETRTLLSKYSSPKYAREFAFSQIKKATELLSSLESSPAKSRLLELVQLLSLRKY